MLTTSDERVKLLRKGLSQKQIEKLYIEGNNFKMADCPIIIELVEINDRQNKMSMNRETAVECAQSLYSDMASLCDISQFTELYRIGIKKKNLINSSI